MLKLEEEPPLQSAKEQALGPPPQEIWEPGHGIHLQNCSNDFPVGPGVAGRLRYNTVTIKKNTKKNPKKSNANFSITTQNSQCQRGQDKNKMLKQTGILKKHIVVWTCKALSKQKCQHDTQAICSSPNLSATFCQNRVLHCLQHMTFSSCLFMALRLLLRPRIVVGAATWVQSLFSPGRLQIPQRCHCLLIYLVPMNQF